MTGGIKAEVDEKVLQEIGTHMEQEKSCTLRNIGLVPSKQMSGSQILKTKHNDFLDM